MFASNLRGGSFYSKRREEEAAEIKGFAASFEEIAAYFFIVGEQRVRDCDDVIHMFCRLFLCEDVFLKCDG